MTEREALFAACLDELAAGRLTMEQCVARDGGADPALADRLALAQAVGLVGSAEAGAARTRMRTRLMAALADGANGEDPRIDEAPTIPAAPAIRMIPTAAPPAPWAASAASAGPALAPTPFTTIAPAGLPGVVTPMPGTTARAMPHHATRRRLVGRALSAAAAVVVLCVGLGWGVGNAAASALPGDPLYGVKRGQEWLALTTAITDQRRGEVLIAIADHRLAEAQAEADRGNDATAQDLTAELATDIQQVIALSATMTDRHEGTGTVVAALAQELGRLQRAQDHETQRGNAAFAQTLGTTLANEMTAAQNAHLHLPKVPASGGTHGNPAGGHAKGTATPSGNGHGKGKGGGNGTGGNNGNGDLDVTPTPGE